MLSYPHQPGRDMVDQELQGIVFGQRFLKRGQAGKMYQQVLYLLCIVCMLHRVNSHCHSDIHAPQGLLVVPPDVSSKFELPAVH